MCPEYNNDFHEITTVLKIDCNAITRYINGNCSPLKRSQIKPKIEQWFRENLGALTASVDGIFAQLDVNKENLVSTAKFAEQASKIANEVDGAGTLLARQKELHITGKKFASTWLKAAWQVTEADLPKKPRSLSSMCSYLLSHPNLQVISAGGCCRVTAWRLLVMGAVCALLFCAMIDDHVCFN